MRVKLAKTAGFCMGVRLAMEKVLAQANKSKEPIYTYGPLIHNRQVLELLESKGVQAVDELEGISDGTVVIRAHGIPPEKRRLLRSTGLRVIDATCPKVARVQAIIRSRTRKGYTALIVGEKDHPEVIGLQGYAEGKAHVIDRPEQVTGLPLEGPLFVVAQTTQDAGLYGEIVEAVRRTNLEAEVFDTICDATHNRQAEVASFAGQVEAMVVVGGYHSGNTRRLAQVSKAAGMPTFHVETEKELDRGVLTGIGSVGVTAGASTPNWMIKNVVRELEDIRSRRDSRAIRSLRRAVKFMAFTNILAALGAFSLAHAAALLSGRATDPAHYTLAAVYIWAMHILNRFLDRGASTYNEPDRARFYKRHRTALVFLGAAAQAAALLLAWRQGASVFAAVIALSALGMVYSLPVVPLRSESRWRYGRIKDIPGSKTLSESLAWSVVICLVPLLGLDASASPAAFTAFVFVLAMVYVRSALFDIFRVQGDLVAGVETLPITIGERRTLRLLGYVLAGGALVLVLAGALHAANSLAFALTLAFFSSALTLIAYEKRWLYPGLRLEAMVEGNLLVAGPLASLWRVIS